MQFKMKILRKTKTREKEMHGHTYHGRSTLDYGVLILQKLISENPKKNAIQLM